MGGQGSKWVAECMEWSAVVKQVSGQSVHSGVRQDDGLPEQPEAEPGG